MTNKEVINMLCTIKANNLCFNGCAYEKEDDCKDKCFEAINQTIEALSCHNQDDACASCAFLDTEEWEMPCAKCKRNCKDYWRARS